MSTDIIITSNPIVYNAHYDESEAADRIGLTKAGVISKLAYVGGLWHNKHK